MRKREIKLKSLFRQERNKRGQITLFILIGILIVTIAGIIFYFYSAGVGDAGTLGIEQIPSNVLPIKNYVDECLEQVVPTGIYLLAAQGGYIYSFDKKLYTENIQVAYHMEYNDDSIAPKKGFMEYELSRFIEDSLKLCLNYFEPFDYYEFELGEMEIETNIEKEKIFVKVHYPVTVIIDDSRTTISEFAADFPVRLGHIFDIKDKVLLNLKNTGKLGLSLLSSFDVEFNVVPYSKETLIYSIYDNRSEIDNIPFFFNFAIRIYGNSAPRLEFIPDFVLTKGKEFVYQLEAFDQDGDELRFFTETPFVEVDEGSGELIFTPIVSGRYEVEACVEDPLLAKDCDIIRFMIEDE